MLGADCTVVGGGVVGLAVARALAKRYPGKQICLLEKEAKFGLGVSSRSSEVVHAGIYYEAGSSKARFCVEGRVALVQYCKDRNIRLENRGKLLVATSEQQLPQLELIARKARANHVHDLRPLTRSEAVGMEPALSCLGALFSPSTSVIDSQGYMASLETEAAEMGVLFAYQSKLVGFAPGRSDDDHVLSVQHVPTGQVAEMRTKCLINCAGLGALELAQEQPVAPSPATPHCKANYFKTQQQRVPFSRLIYPLPEAHGLGVHLTIDVHGNARFGPDVEWTSSIDYRVDPKRGPGFESLVRQYWPALVAGELVPDYAGFRPKFQPDFKVLQGRRVVHLLGIESPGLTSSLALAEHVATTTVL